MAATLQQLVLFKVNVKSSNQPLKEQKHVGLTQPSALQSLDSPSF